MYIRHKLFGTNLTSPPSKLETMIVVTVLTISLILVFLGVLVPALSLCFLTPVVTCAFLPMSVLGLTDILYIMGVLT